MRPKPQPSLELVLLRKVMFEDEEKDDVNDTALFRYRTEIKTDFKWVQTRLQAAEREHRQELAEWHKETREEAKQIKEGKQKGQKEDAGTARCLEKLDKLIGELAAKGKS